MRKIVVIFRRRMNKCSAIQELLSENIEEIYRPRFMIEERNKAVVR